MKRRIICAGLSIALGCSPTAPGDPKKDNGTVVTGYYEVTTANGQTLPVVLPKKGHCTETALRGNVVLLETTRFTGTLTYRRDCSSSGSSSSEQVTKVVGGNYVRTGADIVFVPDSGLKQSEKPQTPIVGSVSGSTLTLKGSTPTGLQVTVAAKRT